MFRKIVKQGNNAYTITLPSSWVKHNNLNFGDELEMLENSSELILKSHFQELKKEIYVDYSKLEDYKIIQNILNLYLSGYSKISIKHNSPESIEKVEKELTGYVLEDHSDNFSCFENIVSTTTITEKDISQLLLKSSLYLKRQSELLLGLFDSSISPKKILSQEKLMDKTIMYGIRQLLINPLLKNNHKDLILFIQFDFLGDLISELSVHIDIKNKNHKNSIRNLNIFLIKYLISILSKNRNQSLTILREFRNSISKETFLDGIIYSMAENMYNFISLTSNR